MADVIIGHFAEIPILEKFKRAKRKREKEKLGVKLWRLCNSRLRDPGRILPLSFTLPSLSLSLSLSRSPSSNTGTAEGDLLPREALKVNNVTSWGPLVSRDLLCGWIPVPVSCRISLFLPMPMIAKSYSGRIYIYGVVALSWSPPVAHSFFMSRTKGNYLFLAR